MAIQDWITLSKCIFYCSLLTLISSLKIHTTETEKSGYTKYSFSTPTPDNGALIGLYRLKANNGFTCILLKGDALVEIKFKSRIGEETSDTYIPYQPTISGTCQNEHSASLTLSWGGYFLIWEFAKTPGGERWYVNNVELTVSTDIQAYHNIKAYVSGSYFKLVHDQILFPTPIGKSFSCDEFIIPLKAVNQNESLELSGTLTVRALQLQPFMYKGPNFGQAFKCNEQLYFRDDTVPIAVGSTLAIAVVVTICGYGIYRYLKKKKRHEMFFERK